MRSPFLLYQTALTSTHHHPQTYRKAVKFFSILCFMNLIYPHDHSLETVGESHLKFNDFFGQNDRSRAWHLKWDFFPFLTCSLTLSQINKVSIQRKLWVLDSRSLVVSCTLSPVSIVSGEKAIQMLQGIFPLTVYLDLYRRRNNGPTLEKLSSLWTVG